MNVNSIQQGTGNTILVFGHNRLGAGTGKHKNRFQSLMQ